MADTDYRDGFPSADQVRNHLYRNHSSRWMVFTVGEPLLSEMRPEIIALSTKDEGGNIYTWSGGAMRDARSVFIESALQMRPLMADGRECCWSTLEGQPTEAQQDAFHEWCLGERRRSLRQRFKKEELCRIDHHGACQEHGLISLRNNTRCPMGEEMEAADAALLAE